MDGIHEFQPYLMHVADQTRIAYAAGKPWKLAAAELDLDRFATLPDAKRIVVTVYNIYREMDPQLPTLGRFELWTAMAEWHAEHVSDGDVR